MSFRIPKSISLAGWKVRIEEVVFADGDDALADHDYFKSGGLIRICKGLPKKQQEYYVTHELVHAAVDRHHRAIQGGATP